MIHNIQWKLKSKIEKEDVVGCISVSKLADDIGKEEQLTIYKEVLIGIRGLQLLLKLRRKKDHNVGEKEGEYSTKSLNLFWR
ncbi:hypothetical protein BVRB_4g080190 [Beta vulgaris subsp. vulgaris]|nr:hypothetical protein BVRB_4g080190 [Beta vulgaris subsp. vulgaris]